MKIKPISLFLLLPTLVLLAWVGKLQMNLNQGIRLELPIMGYDPRDLISGHYIQYNLDLGTLNSCLHEGQSEAGEQCLCLEPAEGLARMKWMGDCSLKPESCATFIRGECKWKRFVAGVERFYIPEVDQNLLARLPPQSSIILKVPANGQALVEELRLEGQSYERWIALKRAEAKP